MKINQNNKDQKQEFDEKFILEKSLYLEDEIKRLENKTNKTVKEKKKLKKYREQFKIVNPIANRILDELFKEPGMYVSYYYFVKELAEQGDEQCIEDMKKLKPEFHQFLKEKTENN